MKGMSAGFYAAIGTLGAPVGDHKRTGLLMMDSGDGAARLVFVSADRRRHTATVQSWLAVVRVRRRARRASRVIWLLDGGTAVWSDGAPPAELFNGRTGLDSELNPVLWFHARGWHRGTARLRPATRVPAARTMLTRTTRTRTTPTRPTTRPTPRSRTWACCRIAARQTIRALRAALRAVPRAMRLAASPWRRTVPGVFGAAGIVDGARVRVSRGPLGRHAWLRIAIDANVWDLSYESNERTGRRGRTRPSLTIAADGWLRPLDLEAVRRWL
jgi:hypothetical protein